MSANSRIIAYNNADLRRTLEFRDPVTKTPLDLTNTTHTLQVRPTPKSPTVVLECTLANDRIVADNAAQGRYTIVVSKATIDDIAPGVYSYDYVVARDGFVTRMFGGEFVVEQGVVR